jgi:hypothetical protein
MAGSLFPRCRAASFTWRLYSRPQLLANAAIAASRVRSRGGNYAADAKRQDRSPAASALSATGELTAARDDSRMEPSSVNGLLAGRVAVKREAEDYPRPFSSSVFAICCQCWPRVSQKLFKLGSSAVTARSWQSRAFARQCSDCNTTAAF